MLKKTIICIGICCLLASGGFSGMAAVYYIAVNGSDAAGNGSAANPFRWPQKGIDLAQPGDKVVVKLGTYVCQLNFPRSGTPGNPITLEGEPGAVIVGGYDVSGGWIPAPEAGAGVYKKEMSAPFTGFSHPVSLFYNDKMILHIRKPNMYPKASGWARLADPQSSPNWVNIGALHGSTSTEGKLTTYLRFADNRNPNSGKIYASGHWELPNASAITVSGKSHIVIKGLALRNSTISVLLNNGASNNIIENNEIYGAKEGIYIWGGEADTETNLCHGNHIRNNKITLDFFADLNYANVYSNNTWVWDQFKAFSDNDREGVGLYNAGHDNKVYNNHIYKHWGGIQDWATTSGKLAHKDYCKRLEVYGNRLHDILDDALEPTGGEIDAQWHDNDVSLSTVGVRLKGIEAGPVYIYRNRIFTPSVKGASTKDIFFFAETPAAIYIYNNSFSGATGFGMNPHKTIGYPNTWVVNNIFSNAIFLAGDPKWDADMNIKYYNNWFGGKYRKRTDWGKPPAWFGSGNIISGNARLWNASNPTFIVPANSPCRGNGVDVSVPWSLAGVSHNALPGVFNQPGVKPDIGACQSNISEKDVTGKALKQD